MRQHAGGQMQTRRVCRDIKSLPIAAELMRVAPRPGDGAAHLLVHRKQVAASLLDVDEIGDQATRSGEPRIARVRSLAAMRRVTISGRFGAYTSWSYASSSAF